jgi:TetR/AcrR family transcriptional regulator, transcriptional repressor for nem operon
MKVSREAAAQTRERIIESAGELFREKGFDGVGVADIMKQAGLTHGGFYGHFASKDDLAATVVSAAALKNARLWDPGGPEPLTAFLAAYLTPKHRDYPGAGCALAALGGDVAREPKPVREAFTAAVRDKLGKLAAMIPGRNKATQRRKALATMAGVVGALTLARAVADPALSDEFLSAAIQTFGAFRAGRAS